MKWPGADHRAGRRVNQSVGGPALFFVGSTGRIHHGLQRDVRTVQDLAGARTVAVG